MAGFRGLLYTLAKLMGDYNAVKKGKVSTYHIGAVRDYDEASRVLHVLGKAPHSLAKIELIFALADMYFRLLDQRDGLLEMLTPVVVEKWLENGHCDWCPS